MFTKKRKCSLKALHVPILRCVWYLKPVYQGMNAMKRSREKVHNTGLAQLWKKYNFVVIFFLMVSLSLKRVIVKKYRPFRFIDKKIILHYVLGMFLQKWEGRLSQILVCRLVFKFWDFSTLTFCFSMLFCSIQWAL